ncbi:unnamed protein product [Phyllotreta striolata]|uniref:Malate dehydrogenase n=1 Tax=Phyllotreta striolata TaxID=444603 RepID=A0A9N9TXI5_PHYSR|nr:unnamed protein product [Phyllotreta striolata]
MLVNNQKKFKLFLKSWPSHSKVSHRNFSRKPILWTKDKPKLVTTMKESRRFMVDCLKALGTKQEYAETVAENLLEADYRGHYSHGMNRLGRYINEVQKGLACPNADPVVEIDHPAAAVVNGNNGFGAVVGKFSMNIAIEKAKNIGLGIVVSRNSNHYGIAGMYALQAIKKDLIGFSCTNTSPLMVPTRAKQSALGTNPISLGVAGIDDDSFMLDYATTAVAIGKLEIQRRKGLPLPKGWALNEEGKTETDPVKAIKAVRLLPLGGEERTGGPKGFGLGMLVEIFCGILSGGDYGPTIRPWNNPKSPANLSHCFMAINPCGFTSGVELRMSKLMNMIRDMEPANPKLPVLVHGDVERNHMKKVAKDGGLLYVKNQHDTNEKLAKTLKVSPMKSKPLG